MGGLDADFGDISIVAKRVLSGLVWTCLAVGLTASDLRLHFLVGGLSNSLYMTHAGDGSDRLFIIEQSGRIRIFDGQNLISTPFLDISSQVDSGGEKGLLGLAFHPDFATNRRFFVNYTRSQPGLQTVMPSIRSAQETPMSPVPPGRFCSALASPNQTTTGVGLALVRMDSCTWPRGMAAGVAIVMALMAMARTSTICLGLYSASMSIPRVESLPTTRFWARRAPMRSEPTGSETPGEPLSIEGRADSYSGM